MPLLINTHDDTETHNARLAALAASTERYKQHNDKVEASLSSDARIEVGARVRRTLAELKSRPR